MVVPPTWPAILTDADWQNKKGKIAKIAGETGVGGAMKEAEAAFKKIDWVKMDAADIPPNKRDIELILGFKKDAAAYYKSVVVPAREKVKKIKDAAEKTEKAWKANKLIPSSSTAHAGKVADAADLMWMTLKDNSSLFDDLDKTFDKMYEQKKKNAEEEVKKLATTITNLEVALKEVIKNPTKKGWSDGNTSAHQRCRSMCNTIRVEPRLRAKYWATWQKFGDEYHKDAPDGEPAEGTAIKAKIKTVIAALAAFKGSYKAELGL